MTLNINRWNIQNIIIIKKKKICGD